MNNTTNATGSFDNLVESTGRPTLIAVAALGLAIVIGSIVIERLSHGH